MYKDIIGVELPTDVVYPYYCGWELNCCNIFLLQRLRAQLL